MGESSIPVDLFNPGQVFACLGFMEAAEILIGDAEASFDWNRSGARFRLKANGDSNPFQYALDFLSRAQVATITPARSVNTTDKWSITTRRLAEDSPFPFPDPSSPATLPTLLEADGRCLVIDYWGDGTQRDNIKFWGGGGGYPGAALARDAIELVRSRCGTAASDPFALSAAQSSSFRFDWRRDYIPIDTGFSLNSHPNIVTVGFPLVELFAAIGLTNARPQPSDRRSQPLEYRYSVISGPDGALLPPSLMRVALGAPSLPFPQRLFRMHLGWPAKEGQARAITNVSEETRDD